MHLLGLPSVLTIAFIVLKLTEVIDWSWVWVLAPFWISASVTAVFMGLILSKILRFTITTDPRKF